MARMILISEDELNGLIREGISDAVTNITKKITSCMARRSYNNEMFCPRPQDRPWGVIRGLMPSHNTTPSDTYNDVGWCGSSNSGGCGSSPRPTRYSGGCGSGSGGCGSASSYGSGGCGGNGGC